MPIKQLPWRLRWVRSTPRFSDNRIRTLTRLARWTIIECCSRKLVFNEGPFHFVTPPNNFCGLWSEVGGSYEPELIQFVDRTLRAGQTFIDVGANVGIYSAHASRAVGPAGRVIGFEAHPLTARFLRENIALNRLDNVTPIEAAVGEEFGSLEITYEIGNSGSTHVSLPGDRTKSQVPLVRLDDSLRELGVGTVDYLKIDVEGFEVFVLRGALETIRRSPGIIVQTEIDVRHLRRFGCSPGEVFALLRKERLNAHVLARDGALIPVDQVEYGDVIWTREELNPEGEGEKQVRRSRR